MSLCSKIHAGSTNPAAVVAARRPELAPVTASIQDLPSGIFPYRLRQSARPRRGQRASRATLEVAVITAPRHSNTQRLPQGYQSCIHPVQAAPVSATVSAVAGEQSGQPAARPWPGAKMVPLAASVAIGLALRFAVPVPAGVTLQAWTLLAIFVSTIAGAH